MPSAVLCSVFDAVGNQATKSLESLSQKKDEVEKLKLS